MKRFFNTKLFQTCLLGALFSLTQGCSHHPILHDYGDDYRQSQNGAPLAIPGDLKPQPISHYYDVTDQKAKEKAKEKAKAGTQQSAARK